MRRWASSPAILALLALLGLFAGFKLDDRYAPVRYSGYLVLVSADPAGLETQIRTILNEQTLTRIVEARQLYARELKSGMSRAEVIAQFQREITVTKVDEAQMRLAYVADKPSTGVGVLHDLVQALQAGGAPLTVAGDVGVKSEQPWKHRLPGLGMLAGLAVGWMVRRAALGRAGLKSRAG